VSSSAGQPLFLENSSRRFFAVEYIANTDVDLKGAVLHLPAFGEEMNKSRAMVAAQARLLAELGYHVLVPDYYGTGDSEGDLSDASWSCWLEDMQFCLRHLQKNFTGPTFLWGLRLGALMAIELASKSDLDVSRLLLWNPVLAGEQYMLQFLRLRLANSMMSSGAKEKVSDLKQLLEQDGVLEVSGYELSKALFTEISARKASQFKLSSIKHIYWAEVTATSKPLTIPAQQLIDNWHTQGLSVVTENIVGSQFWATQEISQSQQLIEASTQWLSQTAAFSNTSGTGTT